MKQILPLAAVVLALTSLACGDDPLKPTAPPSPDLGTMQVGDVRVLTYDQAIDGLTIPASLSSARYLIVVANSAVNTDVVPSLTINGSWQTVPEGASIAGDVLTPSLSRSAPAFTQVGGTLGGHIEGRLRNYERTLPMTQHAEAAGRLQAVLSRQVPAPAAAVVPAVNSTMTIKTLLATGFDGGDPCSSYQTTTGTVRAVSDHAIIVSDNRISGGGFTDTDYQQIAEEFDSDIYPTDVGYFGTPTDFDMNGRIIIYYTPSVNQLTPPGTANVSGYVGGFFFAGDFFDPNIPYPNGCPVSNEGEIFYLLAPDPAGSFGNTFSTSFVRNVTRGTVAHEFQHMINAGSRFTSGASSFESTWLDEGLAHFAEDAVGRSEAGYSDLKTISVNDLNALASSDPSLEGAFFIQNLSRAKYYVTRPDTTGAIVSTPRAAQNLASRGAEWLMLRYAADWFSNNNPRTFTKALATGPDTGTTNLTKRLGVPIDTLLAHWLVTLYTDHSGIAGLDPKYNYKSYTMRDLLTRVQLSGAATEYLPVNTLGDGGSVYTVGIPPSSGAYFITSLTTGGPRTIQVTSSTGSTLGTKGRFYIVRTQ